MNLQTCLVHGKSIVVEKSNIKVDVEYKIDCPSHSFVSSMVRSWCDAGTQDTE